MSDSGEWLLLIDDDEDIRDSIKSLLELFGFRVETAADGAEGLARMRTGRPPSLVILDYMMPGMNGEEFRSAQLLDEKLAPVPVVVLTGAGRTASHLGVEVMPKPIDLKALVETVRRFYPAPTA